MNSLYTDARGRNALHALAARGQTKLASKLLATTQRRLVVAGLSAKDEDGMTPLHLAAYHGNIKLLRVLLDAMPESADDARDNLGNTVYDALRRPEEMPIGSAETSREFTRLVFMEKTGMRYEQVDSFPVDVWDLALSSNSAVVVVASSESRNIENQIGNQNGNQNGYQNGYQNGNKSKKNGSERSVYAMYKNEMRRLPLPSSVRYVATSNVHSLAISADQCFAWGKNVNGVLGLASDDKIVEQPTALSTSFVEYAASSGNLFSALNGAETDVKTPLIGVACSDSCSVCYTENTVWAWGADRGQFGQFGQSGKSNSGVIIQPQPVLQSSTPIRSVHAGDGLLAVLLTNGQVQVLAAGKIGFLKVWSIESLRVKGEFLAMHTAQGKLISARINAKSQSFDLSTVKVTTVWTPRHNKDAVRAFDIAENGNLVLATRSSVFHLVGREVKECRSMRGVELSDVRTDRFFGRFMGVQFLRAGFGSGDEQPFLVSNLQQNNQIEFGDWKNQGDLEIEVVAEDKAVRMRVHRAVLYARCPALRALVCSSAAETVAVPGGLTTISRVSKDFKDSKDFLQFKCAYSEPVLRFVDGLYRPRSFDEHNLEIGPALNELKALERLACMDLGPGLWQARKKKIGCDCEINGEMRAHAAVLSAASPVLDAQLNRWSDKKLDTALFASNALLEQVLHYVYTNDIAQLQLSKDYRKRIDELLALRQAADELLIRPLYTACERRLFEATDFDVAAELLASGSQVFGSYSNTTTNVNANTSFNSNSNSNSSSSSNLCSSLIDVVARNMPFFISLSSEFNSELVDQIERFYKQFEGTRCDTELADQFETLSLLSQEKEKETEVQPKRRTSSSASIKPVVKPKPRMDDDDEGWVQTRKKTRTKSQPTIERTLRTPEKGLRSGSAIITPNAKNASTTSLASVTSVTSVASVASVASAASVASVPAASTTSVNSNSRIKSKLDDLPTLGSKQPAAKSQKMKFSQKNRNKEEVFHFDNPFLMVQQLVQESPPPQNQNPWKRIPKVETVSLDKRKK